MTEHYNDMNASTARRRRALNVPAVYGFEGPSLRDAHEALTKAYAKGEARMLVRLGLREDGSPEAWLDVRVKDKDGSYVPVGSYNVSFTCPPRPPENCEE